MSVNNAMLGISPRRFSAASRTKPCFRGSKRLPACLAWRTEIVKTVEVRQTTGAHGLPGELPILFGYGAERRMFRYGIGEGKGALHLCLVNSPAPKRLDLLPLVL